MCVKLCLFEIREVVFFVKCSSCFIQVYIPLRTVLIESGVNNNKSHYHPIYIKIPDILITFVIRIIVLRKRTVVPATLFFYYIFTSTNLATRLLKQREKFA